MGEVVRSCCAAILLVVGSSYSVCFWNDVHAGTAVAV